MRFDSIKRTLYFEDDEIQPLVQSFINSSTNPVFKKTWRNENNPKFIDGLVITYLNMLNITYFDLLKQDIFGEAKSTGHFPNCSVEALYKRLRNIQSKYLSEGSCVIPGMPPLPDKALWIGANTNAKWFSEDCNKGQYTRQYRKNLMEEEKYRKRMEARPVIKDDVEETKTYKFTEFNF